MAGLVRIPKGSLILVTGATGLVGGAVVEELARQGYRIRAATRDAKKALPFAQKINSEYGNDAFETVEIKDYNAPNAYDAAFLGGVSGVLHIATDRSFSSDSDKVIGGVVHATVELLKAAANVPSIKSVVLTSSRVAAYAPEYGKEYEVNKDTWVDYFSTLAREADASDPMKPVLNYAASKVEGERAAWAFYNSVKPSYAFSTVLPDLVLGPVFNPVPDVYSGSSTSLLTDVFNGSVTNQVPVVKVFDPPSLIVDVRDLAAVHVGALIADDVEGERLFAGVHGYHVNDLLKIWRAAYPGRDTIPKDFDFPEQPKQVQDIKKSEELLQRFAGRGWLSLKETVLDTVKGREV